MQTKLFIDGEWVKAERGASTPSVSPSTGEKIADVATAPKADTVRAVEVARRAFDEVERRGVVGRNLRNELLPQRCTTDR